MKPLVAVILTHKNQTQPNTRTYTVYNKDGHPLERMEVPDHGQGAHEAHSHFAIHYRLSTAPWTDKLADIVRYREPWETPRLQRCK